MTPSLPPLDMHAHVKPTIPARDLERLGAVVFVATRSLQEFVSTQQRNDAVTVWGVGCHPGVDAAQRDFDPEKFSALLGATAYVSEIGIEGRSKVPMALQDQTFRAVLRALSHTPRIASIHSSGAARHVLDALSEIPVRGAVLHWWRGTPAQTARAVDLGCWFSVNASGVARSADLADIPLDRILTETDHPSGDRGAAGHRQPGAVESVETALAAVYNVTPERMRLQIWKNFTALVSETHVESLLSGPIRRMMAAADREL
ncbi:TatD DNase family protein [Cryobacterium sp. CAN_C3]|uniref:TatD family hydrolase n=1 Tax=unclassified Cryobacterium TaxID=2649013 RepID=UPI0018CA02DD|nr:TatD family hydrolase [Cryobacterium sp. CAN_C3]MEC5154750.1 TatD DNase family protein [Cryobacterium sp. CAN_C3]